MGTLIASKRKIRKNRTKRVAIKKTKHGYQKVKTISAYGRKVGTGKVIKKKVKAISTKKARKKVNRISTIRSKKSRDWLRKNKIKKNKRK